MHPIIYDVAISADGFIADVDGDVSGFPHSGPVVDDYTARLATYKSCLMGRKTYEFAYPFGLEPGQNPYPDMDAYVISNTIKLPFDSAVKAIGSGVANAVAKLRHTSPGPIYLCGGGELAGWLMAQGLIDKVRLKRAPLLFGSGVSLFGGYTGKFTSELRETRAYPNGVFYQEFTLNHSMP